MPGTFDGSVGLASVFFPSPGSPDFRMQSGAFASASLVAPGTTRLAFQQGIAPEDAVASLSLRGSTDGTAIVSAWTTTYLEVLTSDAAGAPAELDFDLVLLQQPTGIPYVAPPVPPVPPAPPAADLIAWWKSDGILGLNNGDPVTLWLDDSGTGNDLSTNGGIGAFPTYVASDPLLNNQPAVSFNGGQWLFKAGAPIGMPVGNCAVTVYTVAYFTINGTKVIWYWGSADPAATGRQVGMFNFGPPSPTSVLLNNNNIAVSAQPSSVSTPFVGAWAHTAGANVQADPFYLNGLTGPSAFPVGDGLLDMTPGPNWTISLGYFNSLNPGLAFEGSIAEILVYNATHDLATINTVTAYLKNKWGIP